MLRRWIVEETPVFLAWPGTPGLPPNVTRHFWRWSAALYAYGLLPLRGPHTGIWSTNVKVYREPAN